MAQKQKKNKEKAKN